MGNYQRFRDTYRCFGGILLVLLAVWVGLVALIGLGITGMDGGWVQDLIMKADQTKIVLICGVFVYMAFLVVVILLFVAEYGIKT